MTHAACTSLTIVALVLQAAGVAQPTRIGPTGERLTDDDIQQIARIARPFGEPWLVVGQSPSGVVRSPHPWHASVFLVAKHRSDALRRGPLLYVRADLPSLDDFSAPRHWDVFTSAEWAQVPVDMADPWEVRGGRDLNRPFVVRGMLDDDAIQAIVATVRRTDPKTPGLQVTWPIASLTADSHSRVTVSTYGLDARELGGQVVILEKSSSGWVIARLGGWAT
jgi:hypothetical protein